MSRLLVGLFSLVITLPSFAAEDHWFKQLKAGGNVSDLYRVLYYMPKGGDLHNHNSGSVFSEAWYDIAVQQKSDGYHYFTKVRINNCRDFKDNFFPYHLLFRNILAAEYEGLSDCEKGEYKALEDLNDKEKNAWLNSIRLDKPREGRTEFFEAHWQRLNALLQNPNIRAEALFQNLKELSDEGAIYLESQIGIRGARKADGTVLTPNEMADVFRERLSRKDAKETGMTVRLQLVLLRFRPDAEQDLKHLVQIATDNSDLVVGLNMAGREDNDKGYPARFLSTLRELRRTHNVKLAIHAGEVDEPNFHVRDTLLLGADRIGHGLNLITDDETMRLMRYGPYLVEINLISNLLLEYVVDYSQHPFPEYLRTGIPVALSTDDRGMWDSSLTDEFFVAVTEFDLSWDEIKSLSRNSLSHAFVQPEVKQELLDKYDNRIKLFERQMTKSGVAKLGQMPETPSFICARYQLCN